MTTLYYKSSNNMGIGDLLRASALFHGLSVAAGFDDFQIVRESFDRSIKDPGRVHARLGLGTMTVRTVPGGVHWCDVNAIISTRHPIGPVQTIDVCQHVVGAIIELRKMYGDIVLDKFSFAGCAELLRCARDSGLTEGFSEGLRASHSLTSGDACEGVWKRQGAIKILIHHRLGDVACLRTQGGNYVSLWEKGVPKRVKSPSVAQYSQMSPRAIEGLAAVLAAHRGSVSVFFASDGYERSQSAYLRHAEAYQFDPYEVHVEKVAQLIRQNSLELVSAVERIPNATVRIGETDENLILTMSAALSADIAIVLAGGFIVSTLAHYANPCHVPILIRAKTFPTGILPLWPTVFAEGDDIDRGLPIAMRVALEKLGSHAGPQTA